MAISAPTNRGSNAPPPPPPPLPPPPELLEDAPLLLLLEELELELLLELELEELLDELLELDAPGAAFTGKVVTTPAGVTLRITEFPVSAT